MKRILVILLTAASVCFTTGTLEAQAVEEGNSIITVGLGYPNLGKAVFNLYEAETGYHAGGFGPMHIKYEYILSEKFGVGVSLGYVGFDITWQEDAFDGSNKTYDTGFKGSSIGILARFNYHFATGDKVDPYFGVGAGYNNWSFEYYSDDPDNDGEEILDFPLNVGFETTVGARYYFTDNIGAYAEIGFGKSLLQAGLAIKL